MLFILYSLWFLTAEHCPPLWLKMTYLQDVDVQLNKAMLVINSLPCFKLLCGKGPPEISCKEVRGNLKYNHITSKSPHCAESPTVRW